jgi:hypothetical protein
MYRGRYFSFSTANGIATCCGRKPYRCGNAIFMFDPQSRQCDALTREANALSVPGAGSGRREWP